MGWKEDAQAAYERGQRRQSVEQARDLEEQLGRLLGIEVVAEAARKEIEGVTFALVEPDDPTFGSSPDPKRALVVVVACPKCSAETTADAHDQMAIGQAAAGVPFAHKCFAETPEGRLMATLLASRGE